MTQRKDEVQFRQSLYRFTIVTVLTLFLGLITRQILRVIPLEGASFQAWKEAQYYLIENSPLRIQLSHGFVPIVGLAVDRVTFRDPQCLSRFLQTDDVAFVLDPLKLIQGQVVVSRVLIAHSELHDPKNCQTTEASEDPTQFVKKQSESSSKAQGSVSTKPSNQETVAVDTSLTQPLQEQAKKVDHWLHRFSQTNPIAGWQSAAQKFLAKTPLKRVRVDSFVFIHGNSMADQLVIKTPIDLDLGDDIRLRMAMREITWRGKKIPASDLKLVGSWSDHGLNINLDGKVREGEFKLSFLQEMTDSSRTRFQFDFEKVPFSALTSFWWKTHSLNYLWFNCRGGVESSFVGFLNQPIQIEKCASEGPYGSIHLKNFKGSLEKVEQAEFELRELNLDELLKNKRDLYLSGVVGRYGVLSSQIIWNYPSWQAKGDLKQTEFIFSKQSRREILKMSQIPWSAQGTLQKWSLLTDQWQITEGDFDGELRVDYTDGNPEIWRTQISLHRLVLDDKIYRLMLNAERALLKVYGQLVWSPKGWGDGYFLIATPQLTFPGAKVEQLKLKGDWSRKNGVQLELTSQGGVVESGAEDYQWLLPTTLLNDQKLAAWTFQESSIKAEVKDRLTWRRGYVRFKNQWQLSTEGQRTKEGDIRAWLQWDRPLGPALRWKYQGKNRSGQWVPDNWSAFDWLEANPGYLKNFKSIRFPVDERDSLRENLEKQSTKSKAPSKGA